MVKKTITKIQTKHVLDKETSEADTQTSADGAKVLKRRGCFFCQNKKSPAYTDVQVLRRFLSDRGKILPKSYTHLCSRHQRATTKQIKYARHLSLLPFTPKV